MTQIKINILILIMFVALTTYGGGDKTITEYYNTSSNICLSPVTPSEAEFDEVSEPTFYMDDLKPVTPKEATFED